MLANFNFNLLKKIFFKKNIIYNCYSFNIKKTIYKIAMENLEEVLIKFLRVKINHLMTKLYYCNSDTYNYDWFMNSSHFNYDLLKAHENAVDELAIKYFENKDLYQMVSEWLDLWKLFAEFRIITADPSRFKKKYNGVNEEKTRISFKSQFKKLEQEITKKCKKFKEKNNGKEFLINGLEWSIHLNNFHATSSLKQKPIISVYKL